MLQTPPALLKNALRRSLLGFRLRSSDLLSGRTEGFGFWLGLGGFYGLSGLEGLGSSV